MTSLWTGVALNLIDKALELTSSPNGGNASAFAITRASYNQIRWKTLSTDSPPQK
jgi:hypothetical protein